jgi:hypothetical protein
MAEHWWSWPGRIAVAGLVLGLIAALSNLPYGHTSREGVLRLAWRAAGEQVQLCRERSAEELSRLAPHMRQPLACQARTLPYRLQVRIDGTERIARAVTSEGARGDRPLYVQEDLELAPGEHALEIRFAPSPEMARDPASGIAVADAAQAQALERALTGAGTFQTRTTVRSEPGRIVLVELNEDGRRFRITGG